MQQNKPSDGALLSARGGLSGKPNPFAENPQKIGQVAGQQNKSNYQNVDLLDMGGNEDKKDNADINDPDDLFSDVGGGIQQPNQMQ